MGPGNLPLELYRGDSYGFTVSVWQDEAHTTPTDLAGIDVRAQLKLPGHTLDFTATVTAPNIIALNLPASAWGEAPNGYGRWDLQLTYPDGRVKTLLTGQVTVTGDVTTP